MAGSIYGRLFCISTWGESHGAAVGVTVDGCPAGLPVSEEKIQQYLNRRKPGQSRYTTPRKENDQVEILSGVFDGITTGTPISMLIRNHNQHSGDYSNLASCYRPGHADYTFDQKYGFRDYRGGGRSSGRETIGRVAGGAVACLALESLGIHFLTYTRSIGPVSIDAGRFDPSEISENPLYMPDAAAAQKAEAYLKQCMEEKDSSGGVIECVISGMPAGIGEPVFDKLDARLAQAIVSIGAVKGFEIGSGFTASRMRASENNDPFSADADGNIIKTSNHAGGVLGGISDGSDIVFRASVKPTPSIAQHQKTVSSDGTPKDLVISGRHDPVIVPRAVVVVECMAAVTIMDLLLQNMCSRMDNVRDFYSRNTDK